MPNYIFAKGPTPMNSHFERTLFKSKFCADFIAKPFQSTEHTA